MPSRPLGRVARRIWLAYVVLFVVAGVDTALGAAGSSIVVPRSAIVGGHTYAQWEAKAWQWNLANVRFVNSGPPAVPRCTTAGQHGPVWFLHGDNYTGAGNSIIRVCNIPAGRYLFLLQPGSDCSTVEAPPSHATTDVGLLRCARAFGLSSTTLTLDGRPISPSGIVVETHVFRFTMPARNNELQVSGATHGRAAAYGQPVMLRPLTKGRHTLVRVFRYRGGPALRSTYDLTVG